MKKLHPTSSMQRWWSLLLLLLFLLSNSDVATSFSNESSSVSAPTPPRVYEEEELPSTVTLRAAVFANTVPLAYIDEEYANEDENVPFGKFRGFQPDLLRQLPTIAKELDNVTLQLDVTAAPPYSYGPTFDYVASNCNTTSNQLPLEDCTKYDILVGDYYGFPKRSWRALLSPPILTTAAATIKYVDRNQREVSTLGEAQALREPVCLLDDSWYDQATILRFPDIEMLRCFNHTECIQFLKEERCALFVEDELQLNYLVVNDPQLEVTPEKFDEVYIVWPISSRLEPLLQQMLVRWIYQAKANGVIDALYKQYFTLGYCPIGFAGQQCTEHCSASKGRSDRFRNCVCDSTKWTGHDCETEVLEDRNRIPKFLKWAAYVMVMINVSIVVICCVWLCKNRVRAQVKVAQPFFLALVLVGCLISTLTILAMAQEDEGYGGTVPACVAIPWLYSVGFSITFGALFTKIRRIYILLKSAAEMRRVVVSVKESFMVVGTVLLIDVAILTVWTAVDPLEWRRTILTADKYGEPLSSEGHCTSDHWSIFGSIIAVFHFCLMAIACYMCYLSRNVPSQISDGKYVAMAMVSNVQIFVVGLPVLFILGSDTQTSFFVRAVMIWMNDLVVVFLVFGSLMYSVYRFDMDARVSTVRRSSQQTIQSEIKAYGKHCKEQQSFARESKHSDEDFFFERGSLQRAPPSKRISAISQFSSIGDTKRFASIVSIPEEGDTKQTERDCIIQKTEVEPSESSSRLEHFETGDVAAVTEKSTEPLTNDELSGGSHTEEDATR